MLYKMSFFREIKGKWEISKILKVINCRVINTWTGNLEPIYINSKIFFLKKIGKTF